MIKMYCIFSRESLEAMKGVRGKMAAQAGHAYLHAFWNADDLLDQFLAEQGVKLVELRYFYGLTLEQTADAMDIEYEALRKRWVRVRRRLYKILTGEDEK